MTGDGGPQLEGGYLRIANELYDAIGAFPFTASQLKVMLCVMRKTYGYGKKADDLTVSQIARWAGMHRSRASVALAECVAIGSVRKADGRRGNWLSINKKYDTWKCPESGHRPESGRGVSGKRTLTCPESGHLPVRKADTQKTTPKDNPKRQPQKGNVADAPGAEAPPLVASLWEAGRTIVGEGNERLLGKLVKEHGEQPVLDAIAKTAAKGPAEPRSYLIACLSEPSYPVVPDSVFDDPDVGLGLDRKPDDPF